MSQRAAALLSGLISSLIASAALLPPVSGMGQGLAVPPAGGRSPAQIVPGSALPNTVPFNIWNGLIVMRAVLGDGVPEEAVLDTGLPLSLLMPAVAAKRQVKPDGLREIAVLDRSVKVSGMPAQMVRVERMSLTNVPFGIFNIFETFSTQQRADVPAVWLGTSALEPLAVTIDPRKQEVVFRPANAPPPPKSTRLPFVVRDGRIWMEIQVNGKKKFDALVDTGAVSTMIPASAAAALGLKPVTTAEVTDRDGKPAKVALARLDEVAFGKLKVKDVHALYVADASGASLDKELAIIGNDLLLRYRVTLDFGRKEIAFEALPEPGKETKETKEKKDDKKGKKGEKPAVTPMTPVKPAPPAAQPNPADKPDKADKTKTETPGGTPPPGTNPPGP